MAPLTSSWALTVLLITGVWCEVEEADCSQEELITCAYPIKVDQLSFTYRKEDLDIVCSDLHNGLRCIDDYTRRCLTPDKRSHFNHLYSGTSMVIHEICQPGPYQDEFLRHAPCMKDVRQQYEECASTYQQKMSDLTSSAEAGDVSPQLDRLCCSMHEYLACSKSIVLQTCGEETAQFTAGFLDRMAYSLLKIHCVEYPSGSEWCATESRGSSEAATSLSLLLVAVLLVLQ